LTPSPSLRAATESKGGALSAKWTAEQIPDLSGRTAVVTGANSGLGLVTARELARHGASVTLACRNTGKGEQALQSIQSEVPSASLALMALDLSSLDSVQQFAERYRAEHTGLDLLVNNAGVMAPPRKLTVDGFEMQFGTNHLGHFALTAQLIGLMEGRDDARVVTVSSNAHKMGAIKFDDLQREHGYRRWSAYGQSKLANLMFALELNRRARAGHVAVKSLAAHPGYAATKLQSAAAPMLDRLVMKASNLLMAQSADMGALPSLYAATQPRLEGGSYIGPDGIGEFRGHPHLATPNAAARDEQTAARLWEISERLTGVPFALGE
jgi:NAD(P)-dependent dehydrogenase (short-subunit alcohol dehydrogenase family)